MRLSVGYGCRMVSTKPDPSEGPLIRAALSVAAILFAILGAIFWLYQGPPVPSPYGCYQGAGSPLVRLLPGKLIVESTPRRRQAVAVESAKTGYTVRPGFAFASNSDGTLTPTDTDLMLLVYARPRETPTLSVSVDSTDDIILAAVACPAQRVNGFKIDS